MGLPHQILSAYAKSRHPTLACFTQQICALRIYCSHFFHFLNVLKHTDMKLSSNPGNRSNFARFFKRDKIKSPLLLRPRSKPSEQNPSNCNLYHDESRFFFTNTVNAR